MPEAPKRTGRPRSPDRLAQEQAEARRAAQQPTGPSIAGWPLDSTWEASEGRIRLLALYGDRDPLERADPED